MAYPAEKAKLDRSVGIRLDEDHATMLARIADSIGEGSKSLAVIALIDLYGGKILTDLHREKAEREMQPAPVEVTKWKVQKLSPELVAYLAGLVRAGNVAEVAFNLAGVPPRTRGQWLKRGRSDRTAGRESLYADLATALERAEAECEAEDIARLRAHGKTTWTALAWRLERQHPDRYAQRKRIDGTVQHSVFPVVDWDRLSPLETRTLVELLRKASPELDDPGISRAARPALELVPGDVLDVIEGEAREISSPDAPEKPRD